MTHPEHKILIIDDDEDVLLFMKTLLSDDYQVLSAKTVAEALELTKQENPSIVIVDYKLPRDSGFVYLDKIKGLKNKALNIMLTGYGDKETVLGSIQRGVYAFLEKPINFDELMKTVGSAVTTMKQIEAQDNMIERSKTAQNLAALGLMSGHIMHEIANPIMALSGYASKLRNHCMAKKYDEETLQLVNRMENMCSKISRTARNTKAVLHDLHRSHEHSIYKLTDFVQESLDICDMQMIEHNIQAKVEVNPEHKVLCNVVGTLQIVMNLTVNALHAVRPLEDKWIHFESTEDAQYISLRISDSGLGIDPNIQAKIFEEFFSTKPIHEGSGLGLSTALKIMQDENKGSLFYDSSVPHTTFVLTFPKPKTAAL